MSGVVDLQAKVSDEPYSIVDRLKLGEAYKAQGFPDLAIGEAYIGLLLVDECLGETGEFEDEAFDAALTDYHSLKNSIPSDDEDSERQAVLAWASTELKEQIYSMLIENLISCGNLQQAHQYASLSFWDGLENHGKDLQKKLLSQVNAAIFKQCNQDTSSANFDDLPKTGLIRREIYPWNDHEPDRSSQHSLLSVNELLSTIAPRLEARITELPDLTGDVTKFVKQIGLFAKEDIASGEEILNEKSILTATARLNDSFCDACAAKLSTFQSNGSSGSGSEPVSCPECEEAVFCSSSCLDAAQETYHPALCEADTASLAKDASAKEAADSLYSLLLLRTFAMAVHQDVHPLDLVQVKFLWGDFLAQKPSLPFNLHYNIILPLLMLEKLDVNIFTSSYGTSSSPQFSPWIFNTLYAKFRGTADARQGPDGKPEIGAVHPLWCLANHSCDPNVRWEWEGSMKFWVRTQEQRVKWRTESSENPGESPVAGLREDQEVLGHYCDVHLPLKERREWARGALGGDCMCERCVWESEHA